MLSKNCFAIFFSFDLQCGKQLALSTIDSGLLAPLPGPIGGLPRIVWLAAAHRDSHGFVPQPLLTAGRSCWPAQDLPKKLVGRLDEMPVARGGNGPTWLAVGLELPDTDMPLWSFAIRPESFSRQHHAASTVGSNGEKNSGQDYGVVKKYDLDHT